MRGRDTGSRVLILRPRVGGSGGVSNYYDLFSRHYANDQNRVDYFYVGRSRSEAHRIERLAKSAVDTFRLVKLIRKYDVIHLNPSLEPHAMIRDGVFNLIAKGLFSKKTIVFFRGWNRDLAKTVDRCFRRLFRFAFSAKLILVLAGDFKRSLVKMGFERNRILVETTAFDRSDVPTVKIAKRTLSAPVKLVYLSRLVKAKGCLEAIQTLECLQNKYGQDQISLSVIGDGESMGCLRNYVHTRGLTRRVKFHGRLEGKDKFRVLCDSHIMIFPTYYPEGLPNVLLEGMAAALPVVTRPVGGIADVFSDGKNGFLVKSKVPEEFAEKIALLIEDPILCARIAQENRTYAMQRFEIEQVTNRIKSYYQRVTGRK